MEDGSVGVMLNVNALFERFGRARGAAMASAPAKPEQRKNRILVVDDSLTTRSLEKSILEAHGFQVQLAVDGMEALERLRMDLPDLVISDVMMPRMTGFQLLERIKGDEATKHLPVILVTSLESREEQQMGLNLGADAYIVKRKFDQRELLSVIRQIL
jgi:two-component system chemotaxis sensor kinase CheA